MNYTLQEIKSKISKNFLLLTSGISDKDKEEVKKNIDDILDTWTDNKTEFNKIVDTLKYSFSKSKLSSEDELSVLSNRILLITLIS